jgi:hypothetical protein
VATFKKSSYLRTEYVGHDIKFRVPDFLLIGFSLVLLVGVLIARTIPVIGDVINFIPANPSYWASIF